MALKEPQLAGCPEERGPSPETTGWNMPLAAPRASGVGVLWGPVLRVAVLNLRSLAELAHRWISES